MQKLAQENAILSDQSQRSEKRLQQTEDKIEALRHEKLFLVQEKAELVGHLQRIKSMPTS